MIDEKFKNIKIMKTLISYKVPSFNPIPLNIEEKEFIIPSDQQITTYENQNSNLKLLQLCGTSFLPIKRDMTHLYDPEHPD